MRVLIALLLTSTAASADPNAWGHTMPPARYADNPSMPVNDNILPLSEVQVECKKIGAVAPIGHYFLGCALPRPNICTIYRIDDVLIRKHEFGHCAGWPGDHPNEAELRTKDRLEVGLKQAEAKAIVLSTQSKTEIATISSVKIVGASSINPPILEYPEPFGYWGPMKR